MKKLQLFNIIILALLIIAFIGSIAYVGKAGIGAITKSTKNTMGDYLSLIVLVLEVMIVIIGTIYFFLAISFYNSDKNENGAIKTACWINIIMIFIFLFFAVVVAALGQSLFKEDPTFMLNLITGTGVIWGATVQAFAMVLSFILFIIGYSTAPADAQETSQPSNLIPLLYSGR